MPVFHADGYSLSVKRSGEFRGIPEAVERIEVGGHGFYKITMVLTRPEDQDFNVAIYASESILCGFVPQVGQPVDGFQWLQGRLASDAVTAKA